MQEQLINSKEKYITSDIKDESNNLNQIHLIKSLIFQIKNLTSEIHKMTGIANETMQNNVLWRNKYQKLKELYNKNIKDELLLEDIIAGNIEIESNEDIDPVKEKLNKKLREQNQNLLDAKKEIQEELKELQNEIINYEKNNKNNENLTANSKKNEKKIQSQITQLESEINQCKKEITKMKNKKNYQELQNELDILKEEKQKYEDFNSKKKKSPERTSPTNKQEEKPMETSQKPISNVISPKSKNKDLKDVNFTTKTNKPHELEVIKEVKTNEKIEEASLQDFSKIKRNTIEKKNSIKKDELINIMTSSKKNDTPSNNNKTVKNTGKTNTSNIKKSGLGVAKNK